MVSSQQVGANATACVEHGIWTPVPTPPPSTMDAFTLHYKDIDAADHDRIVQAGRMTFHLVGCTGDFSDHQPQQAVAVGMAAQIHGPDAGATSQAQATNASFLYHLGDIIYKPGATSDVEPEEAVDVATVEPDEDRGRMYNEQFYAPYAVYQRPIFAIAGNHDGKHSPHYRKSAINHFFTNFCSASRAPSPDNRSDSRGAMTQPYIYWRLNTPLAHIIGLYSNIANGGILDDPSGSEGGAQYQWLVTQLRDIRSRNTEHALRKAVVLAVHYPPYSGASNFPQRGDPRLGPTNARGALPLGAVLQQAFAESGQRPDVIVSAHAHLYQRLTYRYADGWELPVLVAGSGGHAPVERLFADCDGTIGTSRSVPFDAVLPQDLALPMGDRVQVVAYNDQSFGFLRLTFGSGRLTGEYFAASPQRLAPADSFNLDLATHQIMMS